jgi:predicted RNA-binding protein associated with RNAse of E/G family
MYKLLKDPVSGNVNAVLKDGYMTIPFAPDNTDYQAYLKWLDEGNTPLPADEGV